MNMANMLMEELFYLWRSVFLFPFEVSETYSCCNKFNKESRTNQRRLLLYLFELPPLSSDKRSLVFHGPVKM